ncbi:hypothetical protein [Streptomyces sp. NPDC059639]|uniref:hypothetical protein n=1 Tax=Streptomyces sp. NPDC059639 TaxID=3346891 RepID=UPI0036ADE55F
MTGTGAGVRRAVHDEWAAATTATATVPIGIAMVWPVRGVPDLSGFGFGCVLFAGLVVMFALLAWTRTHWAGGSRQWWVSAVPLADPDTALPTVCKSWARSFYPAGPLLVPLCLLVGAGLFWDPLVVLGPLFLVPERVGTAMATLCWERKHGLVLWSGDLPHQPLATGQRFYSSRRPAKDML